MIPGGMPKTRISPRIKGSKKGFMLSMTLVGFIVGALALMMFTGGEGDDASFSVENAMNTESDVNQPEANNEFETDTISDTEVNEAEENNTVEEDEQPDFFIHVLKKNENYTVLAVKYYNDGRKASIIEEANPTLNARRLQIGAKIKVPNLKKNKPETASETNTNSNTNNTSTSKPKKNDGDLVIWPPRSNNKDEKTAKKTTHKRTPWDPQDQPSVPDDQNVGTMKKVVICKQSSHSASPGDSPVSLALKYYGNISLKNLIENANPLFDWYNIKGGEKVVIPEYSEMQYVAPKPEKDVTPSRNVVNDEPDRSKPETKTEKNTDYVIYVVREDDSLWKIAQSKLGNGARYKEIMELNGLTSENLSPGMKLKLPK